MLNEIVGLATKKLGQRTSIYKIDLYIIIMFIMAYHRLLPSHHYVRKVQVEITLLYSEIF